MGAESDKRNGINIEDSNAVNEKKYHIIKFKRRNLGNNNFYDKDMKQIYNNSSKEKYDNMKKSI